MEARELLEKLSIEDIKQIMSDLYGCSYTHDRQGNVIFQSACCGSHKNKLYCYKDTNDEGVSTYVFHCYICQIHGDILTLIQQVSGYSFSIALKTVGDFLGVDVTQPKKLVGITRRKRENEDMAFLSIHNRKLRRDRVVETVYDESILQEFDIVYPQCWQDEGIDGYTADKFDIRYDHDRSRAIIPVRNVKGELIGIRVRNFEQESVDRGFKYLPLDYRGQSYRFATGSALYGIYENQEVIRRKGKVLLVESEKSVMQLSSFYEDECFALAVYGSNFSRVQMRMLLELGINEVTLGFDKEYCEDYYADEYKGKKEQRQMFLYFEKLKKICKMLHSYVTVNIIIDFDNLLSLKDAPTDKGKEVFEKLYRDRITIDDIDKDFEEIFGI